MPHGLTDRGIAQLMPAPPTGYAATVAEKPKKTYEGLELPDGWEKAENVALFWKPATGEFLIEGIPPPEEQDPDGELHDCDCMGCGWAHVVYRGEGLYMEGMTTPNPPTESE